MTRFRRLNSLNWLIVGGIVAAIVGMATFQIFAGHSTIEAAQEKPTPPGQLTRQTISGVVVAVSGSSITIGTQHGNVEAGITSQTSISAGPEKDLGPDAINVGDRIVVHLNRSPLEKPKKGEEGVTAPDATGATTTATTTEPTTTTEPETSTEEPPSTTTATTTESTIPPEPPPAATTTATTTEQTPSTEPTDGESPATTTESTTTEETTATTTATSTEATVTTTTATTTEAKPKGKPEDKRTFSADLPPFRTVVAMSIHLGPKKKTRSHKRATLQCVSKGKLEVIGDDGEVTELDDESPPDSVESGNGTTTDTSTATDTATDTSTTTDTSTAEAKDCKGGGKNLILLARKKKRDSDEFVIRGKKDSDEIKDRLARIKAKLEEKGKGDRAKLAGDLDTKRDEREQKRLERALARAGPKVKEDLERALGRKPPKEDRDKGPSRDKGPKDTGPKDTGPKDTGPKDTGPKDTGPKKDTGPPADKGKKE